MTQHQLVRQWIFEHGSITPAVMSGKVYYDTMFGSQTDKRCRELRKTKELDSAKNEKGFEVFFFYQKKPEGLNKRSYWEKKNWISDDERVLRIQEETEKRRLQQQTPSVRSQQMALI